MAGCSTGASLVSCVMKKKIQIFGLGQCSLDCIGIIDSYPPSDTKCEFSGMKILGGGPAATALVALSRWGLSCCLCGVIGDDIFGGMIKNSLETEGIFTGELKIRPGYSSQFAFIAAEPAESRRTIFWQRPTAPPLVEAELNLKLLRNSLVLHTDGLFMAASLAAAQAAHDAKVPVVVDAGTLREGMRELAQLSDIFVASEAFANQLTASVNPEDACRKIAEFGPMLSGVTLGASGYAAILKEGQRVRYLRKPAYEVNAIDTTGCGDVFHAALVFAAARKLDMETRARSGCVGSGSGKHKAGRKGRHTIPGRN